MSPICTLCDNLVTYVDCTLTVQLLHLITIPEFNCNCLSNDYHLCMLLNYLI